MSTQSDTPRTDSAIVEINCDDSCCAIHLSVGGVEFTGDVVCADVARDMECENAALKKQRDHLLKALKGLLAISAGHSNPCGHDFHCVCAYDEARDAIASVEGGVK